MKYWLLKSEPGSWSWQDQQAAGSAGTDWDGVRNWQAAANMKAMALGDPGFFYHSVREKRLVGIVEVCGLYRPDPSDPSGRFGMVRVRALQTLPAPVTLAQIKADPAFGALALVRQSRLSVAPVDEESWRLLCRLGGVTPA